MQYVDRSALEELVNKFDRVLDKFPEEKAKLLLRVGELAKKELDLRISGGSAGYVDGGRKLRDWQKVYMGSQRGYSAVRAIASYEGDSTGKNSPGAITNYHESGFHPSGSEGYINGKFFYRSTISIMENVVQEEMKKAAEALFAELK